MLPPRNSPNPNAYIERWFCSLKSECLECTLFFKHRSLENAVRASVEHDHAERNHPGLGNELMKPGDVVGSGVDPIESRE